MQTGRNAKKKRMGATVTIALLAGAAFLAAAPAGALSLNGWGGGQADALWGAYSELASPEGEVEQDVAGSAHTAAEVAGSVEATPPDPQPAVDEATDLAMKAKAEAEARANALLAQRRNLAGSGGAKWGIHGSGDGSYDVILGGSYDAGARGTAVAHMDKAVSQRVDVRGHERAAQGAIARAEGEANGALEQVEALWGKLHASMYLGLDGAAKALGSFGMDIAGLFGFQKSAQLVNTDSLHLGQQVDVAPPALDLPSLDVPEPRIPSIAVEQGGEVAADAAATAAGAIRG